MIPKEKTYPVFESNQVLTNAHLNQMLEYLDEQSRLSRANLIGVGVVCGMETSWDGVSHHLSISHGCGVTSEGYLAHVGVVGDEPEDCSPVAISDFSTDRYNIYEVPGRPGYAKFHEGCDLTNDQFELWQLVPQGAADYDTATELDEEFLKDKVVLLHVELDNEQLKNCSPNSCDDKGSEMACTIRPLLISKDNAEKLNIELEGIDTLPDLNERLGLPDIRMPRLNVPNHDMVTAEGIFRAYFEVLLESSTKTMFLKMGQALSKAQDAFAPIVKEVVSNYPFPQRLATIENRFRNLFHPGGAGNQLHPIYYAQYYYDFLCDLIQAYDEFRWKGLELMALCCPHEALFPRHLFLGEVFTNLPGELQVCRHWFRPAMTIAHAQTTAEEVQQLFERLVLMIKKFDPTGRDDIRITPSCYGKVALSKKAIPYYYRDSEGEVPLYQRWDFSKNKIGRAKQNLGYHSDKYADVDFVKKPLLYDLEPYNFFRIEGHIGRSWNEVLRSIMKDIKTHRLPFDVVVLNAANQAVEDKDNPWKNRCIDNDLDVIHRIWVNEINCMYQQKIGYLTKTKIGGAEKLTTGGRDATGIISRDPTRPFGVTGVTAAFPTGFTAKPATNFGVSSILTSVVSKPVMSFFTPATATAELVPSTSSIFLEVDKSTPSIGTAVLANVDKTEVNTPAKLKTEVNKELLKTEEYAGLPVKEYQIAAGHKVNVVADMLNVAEELGRPTKELDYDRLFGKFETLDISIQDYLDDLFIYNPNDKEATLTEAEVQEMIRQMQALQSSCLKKRLAELKKEMDDKRKAVDELIFFSRYVTKHPDLRHKAGVPSGGTFVLVFQEKLRAGGLNGRGLRVPEGKVIADFFLPYRCCSDCPPVQFVLPPSRPVFNVRLGCADENDFVFVNVEITHGIPPFEIKIDGGEYQLLNGGVELNPGEHTLVVRDAEGGESLPKKVTTTERMKVSAESFDCDASNEFYVARLRVENGTPPFSINGKEVPHEEGSGTEAGIFFLQTDSLESGQGFTLEVGDGSECPPIPLEISHTCETQPPVPKPDEAETEAGKPVNLNVLANDEGQGLKVSKFALKDATMGNVVITEAGDLTYTPSAAAAGKTVVIEYEVTDEKGLTAESTIQIKVSEVPCDLPGKGLAQSCRYRLWMQAPDNDIKFESTPKVKVEKLVVNGNIDLTSLAPPFEFSPDKLTSDKFDSTMKAWVKKLNAKVQANVPAEQKDWWTIGYETNKNGYGMLRIEHFMALPFTLSVSGSYRLQNVRNDFEFNYLPDEGTIGNEAKMNIESPFEVVPFDCTKLDKCIDSSQPLCDPAKTPKLGINILSIEKQGTRIVVKLEGNDESGNISTWLWESSTGVTALPNERVTTFSFRESDNNNFRTVRLLGFTKKGCMGMVAKVLDIAV